MERAGEYFLDFESQINESSVIGCNEKKVNFIDKPCTRLQFPYRAINRNKQKKLVLYV